MYRFFYFLTWFAPSWVLWRVGKSAYNARASLDGHTWTRHPLDTAVMEACCTRLRERDYDPCPGCSRCSGFC